MLVCRFFPVIDSVLVFFFVHFLMGETLRSSDPFPCSVFISVSIFIFRLPLGYRRMWWLSACPSECLHLSVFVSLNNKNKSPKLPLMLLTFVIGSKAWQRDGVLGVAQCHMPLDLDLWIWLLDSKYELLEYVQLTSKVIYSGTQCIWFNEIL